MNYCPSCGNHLMEQDAFCAKCGHAVTSQSAVPVSYTQTATPTAITQSRSGLGASITSTIVGAIGLFFLLYDFAQLGSVWFTWVEPAEIGLLSTISAIAIVFGSIGSSKKHTLGYVALSLGLVDIVLVVILAQYLP